MLQFANYEDMSEVIAIWRENFGDTKEEIRDFFSTFGKEARVCLWIEEGRIMGQLVLLPVCLQFLEKEKSKSIPAEYLYAVATKKCFQNRGVCTSLLGAVSRLLQKEGKAAVLVPADAALASFYEDRGFQGCFAEECVWVEAAGKQKGSAACGRLLELDASGYEKLRKNAFVDSVYVELPQTMLAYAVSLCQKEGGACAGLSCPEGEYGVLYRPLCGGQELYIQEITAKSNAEAVTAAKRLLAVTGAKKAMLRRSYAGKGMFLPEGMPENGYFNLVLE